MSQLSGLKKARQVIIGIMCVSIAFLLVQSEAAFGGAWNVHWNTTKPAVNTNVTTESEQGSVAVNNNAESSETAVPLAPSAVPKLFWYDCGVSGDCTNAAVYYVDPAATAPVKTLFDSGVFIVTDGDPDNHAIAAGNFDISTFQIADLKTGNIVYFKGGKIYAVDTTSLIKKQLSNESGVTADKLCQFQSFVDWQNSSNSTIFYILSGADNQCWTGDDVTRAVKLSTSSTSAPISLVNKQIAMLLFGSKYLVWNWGTSPARVQLCPASLTGCTNVTSITGNTRNADYDPSQVLFMVNGTYVGNNTFLGGTLMSYNYSAGSPAVALYTAGPAEIVGENRIDRDGFVYFVTMTSSSPYTGSLKKVPIGGGTVTTLHSFSIAAPQLYSHIWLDISSSYIAIYYPNSLSGTVVSVKKTTGAVTFLSSGFVDGGLIEDVFFMEDTSGSCRKMSPDGVLLASKPNCQLTGATLGGLGDWHYRMTSSTFRFLLSGIDNKVRSCAFGDDFSVATAGIAIGTVPVNLSNVNSFDSGYSMLSSAKKRGNDFSFGSDILYWDASTASTLKRISNNSGPKGILVQTGH
jgi:hypothetical protein